MTLYYIAIYPIELILEICFTVIDRISDNPGIAIIGMSIVINFLLLPLYLRADSIQAEEREKQTSMERWIKHIRRVFNGDEKVMMISAYYAEQDYHPLYALRSSVSLLLQIPFFIAAYHFLSHLSLLHGASFLCIKDLGSPDGLLSLGSVSINILPILMTLINCIAALIYTRGTPIKQNLQIYILAGLFLVLLYPSPSGLVLYWTMNNVFSLVKNIILKKPAARKNSSGSPPLFTYLGGVVTLTLLIGLLIPSALVASSPTEFVEPSAYRNPLSFVFSTFCVAAGLFLCWISVFYALASAKAKRWMSLGLWLICGIASINYFFFARDTGVITADLQYNEFPQYALTKMVIQLVLLTAACMVMVLIWKKKELLIQGIYVVMAVSILLMSVINIRNINRVVSEAGFTDDYSETQIVFPISQNGKNVVFIMLDAAISGYLPYMLQERPELKEIYSGFVYYPNTISFGMHTNFGSPALFGGYEYSPVNMNSRSDMTLKDKHNEALKVMPVLFSRAGYQTTVCDVPYANYKEWPDLSIYEEYPAIQTYHTTGKFVDPDYYALVEEARRRSFVMYSVVRISPKVLQSLIYDDGQYLAADKKNDVEWVFTSTYSVLKNFINMTKIEESEKGTFLMIDNNTTHDTYELQLPEYEPSLTVNNSGLETGYRLDGQGNRLTLDEDYRYHAHMASLLRLGEWINYLKENNVYDNTRIIIVADHGWPVGDFPDLIMDDGTDMEAANPLFMVKDFGATGFETSDEFMTNADAPLFAMGDIIGEPVNPFTNQPMDDREKRSHDQYVTASGYFSVVEEPNVAEAHIFDTSDAPWYSVHDEIREIENWSVVAEPKE